MLKVVLLADVQGIGVAGTVKEVKNGYARNYLLPRKLATPATRAAIQQVEQRREANERKQVKLDAQAAGLAGRIAGQEVRFSVRAGEEGRLYGSVTNADIAALLSRQMGEEIDRRRVVLEDPIQRLGTYEVPVRLSGVHSPVVRVVVESEGSETQAAAPVAPEALVPVAPEVVAPIAPEVEAAPETPEAPVAPEMVAPIATEAVAAPVVVARVAPEAVAPVAPEAEAETESES